MYIQYGKQKCRASGRSSQLKVKKKVQSETLAFHQEEAAQTLDQGLSKHQEVSSTPVTQVKKVIVDFWDLLGAVKR